ncbi:MAG TPA: DinB family protein [Terriglobales bacterium]|nr:DinB family protein [Terriglobales bacterium]
MEFLEYLRKLYVYDHWANQEVTRALRTAPQPPARSLRLMAHVVGTEWTWRSRILSESKKMAVWPQLTVEQILQEVAELKTAWTSYLGQLTPARLTEPASYTNSKGEHFSSQQGDILMHVVMHSAYHRGQIAADMRASGLEPVYTDFIHAVRQAMVGS